MALINDDGTGKFRVYDELVTTKGTVKAGDQINIIGERGKFTFIKYVMNVEIDKSWVDVISVKKDGFRSFRPDRVKV